LRILKGLAITIVFIALASLFSPNLEFTKFIAFVFIFLFIMICIGSYLETDEKRTKRKTIRGMYNDD